MLGRSVVNSAKDCANGLSGGASFKTISPVAVSNGQNRRQKKDLQLSSSDG